MREITYSMFDMEPFYYKVFYKALSKYFRINRRLPYRRVIHPELHPVCGPDLFEVNGRVFGDPLLFAAFVYCMIYAERTLQKMFGEDTMHEFCIVKRWPLFSMEMTPEELMVKSGLYPTSAEKENFSRALFCATEHFYKEIELQIKESMPDTPKKGDEAANWFSDSISDSELYIK